MPAMTLLSADESGNPESLQSGAKRRLAVMPTES
jgi:hypothetical protein